MRVRVSEAERATWADLAARYRFNYGMTLQERLDFPLIRADVNRWWSIGGKRETVGIPILGRSPLGTS
jgi:hypothetical protein